MENIRITIVENVTNVRITIAEKSGSDINSHNHNNKSVLDLITEAFTTSLLNNIITNNAHVASNSNPHNVTKSQIGLSNVDNTADLNKPVSTAMGTAIESALIDAQAYADGLFDTITGTSPTDLDTIQEISAALQNNPHIIQEIITALGNRIRFDVNNQGLSHTEKINALTNLGIQNIDNTSDADKPVSTAVANELSNKVDKVNGKGLALPKTKLKLASNFPSNTTTRTTVTGWTYNVVAGKDYKIEVNLNFFSAATATGGSLGFILSSGAGSIKGFIQADILQSAAASGLKAPIYAISNNNTLAGSFMTTPTVSAIAGEHNFYALAFLCCGTSGVLEVQWASEVAGSSSTIVAESWLLIEEI